MHPSKLLPLLCGFLFLFTPARSGILEDRAIEDAIQASFVFRELLSDPVMVQVYVRYGAVELRGQVADEREHLLVGDLIAALPDVRTVDNRLFVDSAHRRTSDRWIAARLRALLLVQNELELGELAVQVRSGEVALTGRIRNEAQSALAEAQVRHFAPDRTVRNGLVVAADLPQRNRSLDDASIVALAWDSLRGIPTLQLSAKAIKSESGHVTVDGIAGTPGALAEIDRRLSTLRGVRSSANRVLVRN